jgi:hypothetical protein
MPEPQASGSKVRLFVGYSGGVRPFQATSAFTWGFLGKKLRAVPDLGVGRGSLEINLGVVSLNYLDSLSFSIPKFLMWIMNYNLFR